MSLLKQFLFWSRRCTIRALLFNLLLVSSVTWFVYRYLLRVAESADRYDYLHHSFGSGSNGDGCPIPELDPYDKSIRHLLEDNPPEVDCEAAYPLLFQSDLLSTSIFPVKDEEFFFGQNITSCCYRTVKRPSPPGFKLDERQIFSEECYPLSLTNATPIPRDHEFVAVYCNKSNSPNETVMMDIHAFVNLKTEKTAKVGSEYNVIIFGLDAVSRMNFLRSYPLTYSYLVDKLGAVEMLSYNKVSSNTNPNLMPMLTSYAPSELYCDIVSMDACPYIWKEYSSQGYYTSLTEDAPGISMFNFQRPDFIYQPTDYYIRPLIQAAEEGVLSYDQISAPLCLGPRLSFQYLLDYLEKFVARMRRDRKRFFHYTWATAITHDDMNAAKLGDPHLLASLTRLVESDSLNDTIVILMSDHGYRVGNFRNTVQGQLEDRLPFMFLLMPPSFRERYVRAFENLGWNRKRLITTFDMHETLEDILHLNNLEEKTLGLRELDLIAATQSPYTYPRGISLFLPIPKGRTCLQAGIEMNYCACNYMKLTSLENPIIPTLALLAVSQVNSYVAKFKECAHLQLGNVSMAQHAGGDPEDRWEAYLLTFSTSPGGALFEAMVSRMRWKSNGKWYWHDWGVQGSIARTNLYGNQSACVHDADAKSYCFCQ